MFIDYKREIRVYALAHLNLSTAAISKLAHNVYAYN